MDFVLLLGHCFPLNPSSIMVMPPCLCPGGSVHCFTDWPSNVGRDPADSSHFTPWATHSCCTNCLGPVEHSESALDLDLALPSHRSKPLELCHPQFLLLSGDLDPHRGNAPQLVSCTQDLQLLKLPKVMLPKAPLRLPQGPGQNSNPSIQALG